VTIVVISVSPSDHFNPIETVASNVLQWKILWKIIKRRQLQYATQVVGLRLKLGKERNRHEASFKWM